MFGIVFTLLKPNTKTMQEIHRWKMKDKFRLNKLRKHAKDNTNKPFM